MSGMSYTAFGLLMEHTYIHPDHTTLQGYFPLQRAPKPTRDVLPKTPPVALPAISVSSNIQNSALSPGQSYTVYSSTDILGTVHEDYDIVVQRAATWTGVDEEFIHGIVENLERRLWRWWDSAEGGKRKTRPQSSSSLKSAQVKARRRWTL